MAGGLAATAPRSRIQQPGPLWIGTVGGLVALGVALARLVLAADGDVTRFVVAGDQFVDPDHVESDVHVNADSSGYDGQFFWRLAADPAEWDTGTRHGVSFDTAYRPSRIVYPLLAWLTAGGQPGLVAWTLVGVNVMAVGVVAGLGAMVAERGRRPAVAGLLVASAPGLVFALARDLSDVVTLAAVLAGIVALQRDRPGVATLAWCVAVLSREQALVTVGAYALWRLWQLLTRRRVRLEVADVAWLAPFVAFAVWQAMVAARIGELPAVAGGSNLTLPFGAVVPVIGDWVRGDMPTWGARTPFEVALGAGLAATALMRASSLAEDDRWLSVLVAVGIVLAVSFTEPMWVDAADFRQLPEIFSLAWLILLLSPKRIPHVLVGANVVIWVATAGLWVGFV